MTQENDKYKIELSAQQKTQNKLKNKLDKAKALIEGLKNIQSDVNVLK